MRARITMEVVTDATIAALGCKDAYNVEVLGRGDVHMVDVLSVSAVLVDHGAAEKSVTRQPKGGRCRRLPTLDEQEQR